MKKWEGKTAKNFKMLISEAGMSNKGLCKWGIEEKEMDSLKTLPVKENGKTFLIHSELFPIPNEFSYADGNSWKYSAYF